MKLPAIWDLPQEIRHRVSSHQGRQRAMEADGHILLMMYRVPQARTTQRDVVYLWRKPTGEWEFSERGTGMAAVTSLLDEYEAVVEAMETKLERARLPDDWHAVTERIAPVHRAIQHLYEVLQESRRMIPDVEGRAELQGPCDQASNIARASEQLLTDARNAMEFFAAKQSYIQAQVNRDQARAAFRLNILAAVFLPLGTLAAVFGMNLNSGFEGLPAWVFWIVFLGGITAGIGIGGYVLNFKPQNLELDEVLSSDDDV